LEARILHTASRSPSRKSAAGGIRKFMLPVGLLATLGAVCFASPENEHETKQKRQSIFKQAHVAEFAGTCLLTSFGLGVNSQAIFLNSFQGLFQIASAWGLGVTFAIYSTASVSGAHLNPAVSFALAASNKESGQKGFKWSDVPGYISAQMAGAFTGAAINYAVFSNFIKKFEVKNAIVRGSLESAKSASAFACFPAAGVTPLKAFALEAWATSQLMLTIRALTDPDSAALIRKDAVPLLIGAQVALLICLFGPLTQCGMNPARDLGPRLFAALAGWGRAALPGGPAGTEWLAYLAGPVVGATFGSWFYDAALKPSKIKEGET